MSVKDWSKYEYFKASEFDSADAPGSGEMMDEDFISILNHARKLAGVPFSISSGYRTPEHNLKVGGVADSAHTKGKACDIAVGSGGDRYTILKAVMTAGFNRIGIAKGFIHVDNDTDKPAHVIWTY